MTTWRKAHVRYVSEGTGYGRVSSAFRRERQREIISLSSPLSVNNDLL
jgi:hypothetical protein